MLSTIIPFLLVLFSLTSAQFADATCSRLRCSESEMVSRNYAKSLGIGTFMCNATFNFYNADLTVNTSYTIPFGFSTRYDSTTGAYVTKDPSGNIMAEEFCDNKGTICIIDHDPYLAPFHTESYDISKGERGNAARLIHSYEKTTEKRVRRVQHLLTFKGGEHIAVHLFDENGRFMFNGLQTCMKTGN